MACILVLAECEDGVRLHLVLDEQIHAEELSSDSACSELIERLGWAIVDAEEIEDDGHAKPEPAIVPREDAERTIGRLGEGVTQPQPRNHAFS